MAIESYKEVVKINPKDFKAWNNLGIAYENDKNFKKAIESFEKVVQINPNKTETWNNIGIAYDGIGNINKAIDSYKKAVEIDLKNKDAWSNMGHAYIDIGDNYKAIKSYKKSLEIDYKNENAWCNMGTAYIDIGNNKQAIDSYKKVVEINSKNVKAWNNMGYAYIDIGNYKRAIESLKIAVDIDPKYVEAWCNMGSAYIEIGNYKEAIKLYAKALEMDPMNVKAWNNMGYSYRMDGNQQKSIESHEKAAEIDPKYVNTWCNMGITYGKMGNFEKEIESYEKAVEIDPNNLNAWYNMGVAYYEINNYEKAIESYEKAVEIDPNNLDTWQNMGISYKKIGNLEKAKKIFEKTILTEKFRFLRDDVFLCAQVDVFSLKQKLILQKINLKTGKVEFDDEIDCIHTAVTDISTGKFEDYQNGTDTQELIYNKSLEIRSSEKLREINLTPEEKFKALKSWAAGIAEAGLSAFFIQNEIDKCIDLLYPIAQFLMKFMAKVDSDFIPQYVAKIEKDCMFEGIRHESSFLANSIPILEILWKHYLTSNVIPPEEEEIIKTLITMDISDKLFKSNKNFQILRMIVEPEKEFKIVEDEAVSILGMVWDNYLENGRIEPHFVPIIKKLIELDISGNIFKSKPVFVILGLKAKPNYIDFYLNRINEEIKAETKSNKKIEKPITHFKPLAELIEAIWMYNNYSGDQEIFDEADKKILLSIHEFNPPIEFYVNYPKFLYILGCIDGEILSIYLSKVEQSLKYKHLENIFTRVFSEVVDSHFIDIEFLESNSFGGKNLALVFSKLHKLPDLLLKNKGFSGVFLMDDPELVRNVISMYKKNSSENLNKILFSFLDRIFQRFETLGWDSKDPTLLEPDDSMDEYNGLIAEITNRHGENIYDILINIDPFELVTNYSKYLVLLTEIKPEAISYFVNNFHKSIMLESDPKKCIRNMLEHILIILSKKIKEWVKGSRYKGDWKDLPPLITEGEKTLVKSILDLDDELEINELSNNISLKLNLPRLLFKGDEISKRTIYRKRGS